jgi:FxsC-like protein
VSGPDQWIRQFFHELTESVRQQASPQSRLDYGFFDQRIPLGSDWKASLTRALSVAEVFVPLYSPGYFARSWPGREWACYQQRVLNARAGDPLRRFAPVLWSPLPWDLDSPGLRQTMAVVGSEPEYADNGLRALGRLRPYRPAYKRVVERLAAHIVDLAENDRLGPSTVPDIDEVASAFKAEAAGAVFAVTVAAPEVPDLPAGRDRAGYGSSGVDWRPYPGDQELSLAEYAQQIAEQMDFAVLVTSIDKKGDRLTSKPGVILIDPWFIAGERGHSALTSFVDELPVWVLPLLVLGSGQDVLAEDLAHQVRGILRDTAAPRGDAARRAVEGVTSLAGFVALMPILAAEAERQYLRHGPVLRSTAQVGLPRLARDESDESPDPAAPPDPAKETPDA